jgi:hypothetical protein
MDKVVLGLIVVFGVFVLLVILKDIFWRPAVAAATGFAPPDQEPTQQEIPAQPRMTYFHGTLKTNQNYRHLHTGF